VKALIDARGVIHARGNPKWQALVSLLVAATAACLYLPSLGNQFVYDDIAQIVIDDYLYQPAHFLDVLTLRSMALGIVDNNRPVNVASLMLDATIWGRNPFGFHLTNLILHTACCWMLFWLACRLLSAGAGQAAADRWRVVLSAAGAGLLMAVQPINSEAVCVPTFREDLLVPFFCLAGLLLAGRFPTGRRLTDVLAGGAIVLTCLFAVAAKETGVVCPVLLGLYWLLFRRREGQGRKWQMLLGTSGLVVLAFVAARFLVVPKVSVVSPWEAQYLEGTFLRTLPVVPIIWAFHLCHIVWPGRLSADYTSKLVREALPGTAVVYFALGLFLFLLILLARKNRAACAGAGMFWLAILPVSSLLPMFRPIADRYMYFPMAGLSLVFAAALMLARRNRLTRWAAPALLLLALAPLAVVAVGRQAVWHDSEALWRETLRDAPESSTAIANLGFEVYDRRGYEEAVKLWERGVRLTERNSAEHLAALAIGLDALGRAAEADAAFQQAARLDAAYARPALLVRRLRWEQKFADKLERVAVRNPGRGATSRLVTSRPGK